MDGFPLSDRLPVAWLVALLLVAELMRNTGRFTMADVLPTALKQRRSGSRPPSRSCASRCSISSPRWLALVAWCPARRQRRRRRTRHRPVGAIMVTHVHRRHEGHDLGPDHQGCPAHHRRGDHDPLRRQGRVQPSRRFSPMPSTPPPRPRRRVRRSPLPPRRARRPRPRRSPATSCTTARSTARPPRQDRLLSRCRWRWCRHGRPAHVLQRFYTVPTSRPRAVGRMGDLADRGFYLLTLVIGFGAGASSVPTRSTRPRASRTPRPRCSPPELGAPPAGHRLPASLATILAVVAGLTITASATFAHDL